MRFQSESVSVHDLVPSRNEVGHELVLVIVLSVHFGDGPQLRVASKHKVVAGCGANIGAGGTVLGLVGVATGWRPCNAHVEQGREEGRVQ